MLAVGIDFYGVYTLCGELFPALIEVFACLGSATMLLVALFLSWLSLCGNDRYQQNWQRISEIGTVLTAYELFIALAYAILYGDYGLSAASGLADVLKHVAVPLLLFIYWALFCDAVETELRQSLWALLYPFGYLIFSLLLGEATGFFAYDFLDINTISFPVAASYIFLLSL